MSETRRVTIDDIAAEAGVSVASVSYALNGKPGVSTRTRQRIIEIARRYNWEPNHQARALHRASTDVVGLVVPASIGALHDEAFAMLFISGIESELRIHRKSLMLHIEPDVAIEMEIYRSWRRRGVVDCVILSDLRPGDVRIPLLDEIGMPTVLAGRADPDPGWPCCFASDEADMTTLLEHLAGLGLRRFARLGGEADFVFVAERTETWAREVSRLGLIDCDTAFAGFYPREDAVARAIEELLVHQPDVIVADSDLLGVRALQALTEAGVRVPDDVQLVSFDDSIFCQIVTPRLTAVDRDPRELGRAAARLALNPSTDRIQISPGRINERQSTRRLLG